MADLNETIKELQDWIDCPFPLDTSIEPHIVHDALELLKSMQGVPTWSKAEEPPKDDCECLVLTDDGLKFAEWRDGEWGTSQADFINGGFVDDKWEKLPWTVKFWMYDIVVSNEETED